MAPLAGAVTHAKVVDLLVEKGYLARRYPLTRAEFEPALLAALAATPSAGGNIAGDLQNSEWTTDPRTRGRGEPPRPKIWPNDP